MGKSGSREHRRSRRRVGSLLALVPLLFAGWLIAPPAAWADGPTTFSNTAAIAIPATGSANQIGPANPYPSAIAVSGMSGAVSNVTVSFNGLTHSSLNDIDAMLVSPSGGSLVLLSDIGDPTSTLAFANNANLTFSDSAANSVPTGNIPTGTYKPTNNGGGDTFPAPAPAPSSQTTLASVFSGTNPNGNWQLFIVDDTTGDVGTMAGGWSLTVTTSVSDVATTTAVTSSPNPSTTGNSVIFTATVSAGGNPVTLGTVQFTDGATNLGAPVALNGSGQATLSTSALLEGTHQISATYSGAVGFLTSNGSISQRVDNQTVVSGNTFCNTGALTVPMQGASTPYPSNIFVSGLTGNISKVTATLKGLSHQVPVDLDVMLAGPTGTTVMLLSDAGGTSSVSGVDVTLDDEAANGVPQPLASGTFKPTDDDSDGGTDSFPAPAPAPSNGALADFDGQNSTGKWSLYVNDDASGDAGSVAGGWCLTVATTSASSTVLTSDNNPSTLGESVTFTATVTSGGNPVSSGSVQFTDGGSPLGLPIPVASDGTAAFTTSALGVATHSILASYSGAGFEASSDDLSQVVTAVPTAPTSTTLTSDVNPSTAGQSVTLTATVISGGSPVGSGSVQFTDNGSPLGVAVPVALDGTATLTTSALGVGSHPLKAEYSGTALFEASADDLDQIVNAVTPATRLTLVKQVINDSGGRALPTDWTLTARGPSRISGRTGSSAVTNAVVKPGWYTLAESGPSNYTSAGWRCIGATYRNGVLKLAVGASAVCTITNHDKPLTRLTLVKRVINDNGGAALPTAWTLSARGPSRISGVTGSAAVTNAVVTPGRYALSEFGGPQGYAASAWSCVGARVSKGFVNVPRGASIVCTITNNDRHR